MDPEKLDDLPSERKAAPEEVLAEFLVFRVGAVWYAVLAQRVKSVVGATTTVRIPGTPAFVAGVANVSGRIAIVIELGGLLGRNTAQGPTISERLVLFEIEGSQVGVLTDEVSGVTSVLPSALHPLADDEHAVATQTFTDAERHVTVVDVARMISLADAEVRQRGEA